MQYIKNTRALLLAALGTLAASVLPSPAQDLSVPVCNVVVYDEQSELEDAAIALELARSSFGTYEKIFEMIRKLWEAGTVPSMDYIKAKYDRDAARLTLEKANLILERQSSLVEQYRLICGGKESGSGNQERVNAIRKTYVRYRQTDCDSSAKGIEVAATNLEFNREYLKKILKLRQENTATQVQVVLAELDVEREEKSLGDAKHRTETCRADLIGLQNTGK